MFKPLSVFATFLFVFILVQCNEDQDKDNVFVPTKEWQTVKKGQKIPKGLHVRINLESGETEAKLLDDDKTKALSAVSEVTTEDQKSIPKSVLEEAVKNIKGDDIIKLKSTKDKFRSYADIKKTLGELNIAPKMDAEVITDLLKKHNEVINAEKFQSAELVRLLEDLEFLAHQYDNALEFVRQNGFKEIIYKDLNSTVREVKKETLKLMTALMQNNAKVKIHAFHTGSIGVLLRLVSLDPDYGVKSGALTALGALLRSFPIAQEDFVEKGGLAVLSNLFDLDNIKFQVKLTTMISDLLVEHELGVNDEKLSKYYGVIDFTKHVLQHEWCQKLNKLLLGLLITDKEDHDSIEKCLTAMHTVREHCGNKFDKDLLTNLKKHYQALSVSQIDSDVNFYTNLKELCDGILHHVHYSIKTEL